MIGLLLTLLTGVFFLIGIFLSKKVTSKKYEAFSVSLAFVILLNLIIFDIGQEIKYDFYAICFIMLGIILLKVFDLIVPNHHHNHNEKKDNIKEHNNHLEHISIISIVALTLHNIIECMALYNITNASIKSGILMALSIALHNIPLGFQIGNKIKDKKYLYTLILSLSGFIGGLISILIGNIPYIIENYVLSFTLGMLTYLCIFEMFNEVIKYRKNKYIYYGIIIGIIIILLSGLI